MENLRVLEGSEVFFRGLQHLYHQFKSGWRLRKYRSDSVLFCAVKVLGFCVKMIMPKIFMDFIRNKKREGKLTLR